MRKSRQPLQPPRQQSLVLLRRNLKWFRGGLVSKAQRLLYHSPLGSRVIKRKKYQSLGACNRPLRICLISYPRPFWTHQPQPSVQGHFAHEKYRPLGNPSVTLSLGTFGDTRVVGVSHDRGTPESWIFCARSDAPYRGSSLARKRTPLGSYRRPTPRVLWGS